MYIDGWMKSIKEHYALVVIFSDHSHTCSHFLALSLASYNYVAGALFHFLAVVKPGDGGGGAPLGHAV